MSEMDRLKVMAQEHHDMKTQARKDKKTIKRLNAVLDRLGEVELIGITPERTDWLEIYQTEFDARIKYARNRGEKT